MGNNGEKYTWLVKTNRQISNGLGYGVPSLLLDDIQSTAACLSDSLAADSQLDRGYQQKQLVMQEIHQCIFAGLDRMHSYLGLSTNLSR